MADTFRIRPEAERDLTDVWLWGVEQFGLSQADAYQREIARVFSLLGDNPDMGTRTRPHGSGPRVYPYRSVVIAYDPAIPVEIIRVFGARQDWRGLLRDLER